MKVKRMDRLNGGIIILMAIILMGTVFIIFLMVSSPILIPHYEINIERTYSNASERIAIDEAEALDLATILNGSRYWDWDEGTNDPSTQATAYIWPQMVDNESLDFYLNKIEKLQENYIRVRANLNYEAEATEYPEINISYSNLSHTITINEQNYSIEFPEYSGYCAQNAYCHCAIYINSTLKVISTSTHSIQMNFSNGFIISQIFDYGEIYGPLAGFGGGAEQIIVLNQTYVPQLILSRPTGGWIA